MNIEEKNAIERFKQNANYCITSKEITKTILNLIKKQQAELEKKDKIIDLMEEQLVKLREESEEDCFIPRIYRDINECVKTNCKECIKQYFIKKESE